MNKRIGILCSSNSSGGLELNTARLAKWLKERGWEITIYGLSSSPLASMAERDKIHYNPIDAPKKYLDIKGAFNLLKKIKNDGVSLLFVCINNDLKIASLTKLFSGGKLKLIYQQHMQVGIKKKDLIHTIRFSSIDLWLTPISYLAEEIIEKTRFDTKKIRIVPFGIETKNFFPSEYSKTQACEFLHLPQNKIILGVIGRLDPQKGQHIAIEALYKLNKHKDLHLMIMGNTTQGEYVDYEKHLHDLGKKYDITERIHFRPFNEHVQIAYAAIDIFVMSSKDETYGMVTIEAMASGIPVIGTNSGGTKELLEHGKLGLLFTPENSDELADKIDWIIQNQEAARLKSSAGQKNVLDNYSHTKECELVEKAISELK